MPQLLVRNIESSVVRKLRSQAAAMGVSVEEAHRRLLRSALFGETPGPKEGLIAYLRSAPRGDGIDFVRSEDHPRHVDL